MAAIALAAAMVGLAVARPAASNPAASNPAASNPEAATPVAASPASTRLATWSIWTENDQLALVGAKAERWYTQGLGMQRITAWGEQDHLVLSVAHQMFTPASTRLTDPQPADRPYAGALYAGMGFYRAQPDQRLDVHLTLGVLGPSAGAGAVQRSVHRLLGQPLPQGWRYQLPDQVWVQAEVAWVSRLLDLGAARTDLLLQTALEVGHPRNAVQAGLALRTGVLPTAPVWPGRPAAAVHATPHWMAHASATVHGVISDALLDGEPQGSSSLIQRRWTVFETSAGGSWRLRPALWLDAAVTWRERDFLPPPGTNLPGSQRWARIQLRWLSD